MSKLDELKRRTDNVKRAATGRWDIIFSRLVPQVAEALAKPGKPITCPFHGGKNDFRLPKENSKHPHFSVRGTALCSCKTWDGWGLVMDANNWDFPRALEEVANVLGGTSTFEALPAPVVQRTTPEAQQKKDERIKRDMTRWWSQTYPLSAPEAKAARLYLRNRKLGQVIMPLEDIGFHPSLEYFDQDFNLVGNFPAIISIVRTLSGSVSTIHRTYLTSDGEKAPVDEPRKQYKSPKSHPVLGAAIKLDKQVSPVLHVGEGFESALAVRAIVDNADPTWSTLNKELMRGLHIPDHVEIVCIWADRDAKYGGQLAAIELMDRVRAAGKKAVVMLPPFEVPEGKKSIDWNDVVANLGLEATRNHFQVVKFLRELAKTRKKLEEVIQQQKGRAAV